MCSEIFKAWCLLETQFVSESPLYPASTVLTSLNIMCLSQESPRFWTPLDYLALRENWNSGASCFLLYFVAFEKKCQECSARVSRQLEKLQTQLKWTLTNIFCSSDGNFLPVQCQIAHCTNHLPPGPFPSASVCSCTISPSSAFLTLPHLLSLLFFSPSRLDSLFDKPYRSPTLSHSSLTLHSLSLPLVLCLAHADHEPSVLAGPSKRTYWAWCQHLQACSMHPFINPSSASWLGRGLLSRSIGLRVRRCHTTRHHENAKSLFLVAKWGETAEVFSYYCSLIHAVRLACVEQPRGRNAVPKALLYDS